MLAVATLLLALQSVSVRVGKSDKPGRGNNDARLDSIAERLENRAAARRRDDPGRTPRRIPVTPELERSAFRDTAARALLLRAREARLIQDTTLLSYDASAYQRLSVGMGFRAFGKDRLLLRTENASRVRWSRSGGVWIDLKGQRAAFPMMKEAEADAEIGEMSPVPYYPGREALWIGSGRMKAEVDDRELVHPIALGAEAYYTYATGDSIRFTLPDRKVISLREIRVTPRRPEWRLSVGSFWFDTETAQLVRAAYRLAVPMDIWGVVDEETKREREEAAAEGRKTDPNDDVPGWVKGFMSPMQANLEAITIEYGLYGGRFWLPRSQYAEGWARASFMRIPFKMEEAFKYADVNGVDTLPAVPQSSMTLMDSLFGKNASWSGLSREERRERAVRWAEADSIRREQRKVERETRCKGGADAWVRRENRGDGAVSVAVRVPCDTTLLVHSPDLPASIYDPGEELFGARERDALVQALSFGLQPGWGPQRPVLTWGLSMTRFNRVEGLSTGLGATQQLGMGYALDGSARIGTGDWEPNVELGGARSNGRHTLRLGGYRRLAVASDWGAPLSFGSGLGALLYGRDEGFYYRTYGVELERFASRSTGLSLRLFGEHQSTANAEVKFNLPRAMGSATEFGPNITSEAGNALGAGLRDVRNFGLDPAGWRAFTDIRGEGGMFASTDSTSRGFARVSGDVTVSHPLVGRTSFALTGSAGTSERAPLQRNFFLGGAHTVRGQLAGTQVGDSYWLGRAEVAFDRSAVRTVVFGDVGWAGERSDWSHPGRPMSGAGVGASVLDGLIRFDLSRGIYPRTKMRLDLYVEARF